MYGELMSDVSTAETSEPVDPQGDTEPVKAKPIEDGGLNKEALDAMKAEATEGEESLMVEVRDQKFRVVSNLPGIVLLDLGVASDPSATQGEQLRALREFLKAALHEDDLGKFEHYLRSARPIIDIEELNGIVERLLAQIGARPTESPTPS
jgi:hypothetical protein